MTTKAKAVATATRKGLKVGIGMNQLRALELASAGGVSTEELAFDAGTDDLARMERTIAILARRGFLAIGANGSAKLTTLGTEAMNRAHARLSKEGH
jgi:hypothetical protein